MGEEKSIIPTEERARALRPIATPEEASAAMQAYQQLCAAVLIPWERRIVKDGVVKQESDYQRIRVKLRDPETGNDEYVFKDFPKKSAWRKLAKFYRVSTEIVEKHRVDREDDSWVWHYTVKAIGPDGQSQMGEGSCDSKEVHGDRRREHDTKSKAHTRAKNRAISDLIGFGQVSAEELGVDSTPQPRKKVDAEVVEPPKAPETRQGKVSLNVIEYNLRAMDPSLVDMVTVVEDTRGFDITPNQNIDNEDWDKINGVLTDVGAVWKQNGLVSLWRIPTEG